ncbi:MAG: Na+/H+ antiporter subunit E [Pirellulaceae bacterium]|nr:Na+/H+ antiporter subunit E [Pirellulaceae bacterium]
MDSRPDCEGQSASVYYELWKQLSNFPASQTDVKNALSLGTALLLVWLLWSGHPTVFLISLGLLSIAFTLWTVHCMGILDEESVPVWLGLKPFTRYLPWLTKEIVSSNLDVARRIADPKLPISPSMIYVKSDQKTAVGRVIMANSITLTPGTISVELQDGFIQVHALSHEGAAEDLSGEMNRRVTELEG